MPFEEKKGEQRCPTLVKLLLGQVLFDNREKVYDEACAIFRGERGTGAFITLLTETGDRLDGKPTPATVAQTKRTTIFLEAQREPASRVEETTETTVMLAPPGSPIQGYVETLTPWSGPSSRASATAPGPARRPAPPV